MNYRFRLFTKVATLILVALIALHTVRDCFSSEEGIGKSVCVLLSVIRIGQAFRVAYIQACAIDQREEIGDKSLEVIRLWVIVCLFVSFTCRCWNGSNSIVRNRLKRKQRPFHWQTPTNDETIQWQVVSKTRLLSVMKHGWFTSSVPLLTLSC